VRAVGTQECELETTRATEWESARATECEAPSARACSLTLLRLASIASSCSLLISTFTSLAALPGPSPRTRLSSIAGTATLLPLAAGLRYTCQLI
jgi:hypothetical protein